MPHATQTICGINEKHINGCGRVTATRHLAVTDNLLRNASVTKQTRFIDASLTQGQSVNAPIHRYQELSVPLAASVYRYRG